jgi:hypothetical protein
MNGLEPRSWEESVEAIVERLGNPADRDAVAEAIESSFAFYRRCDLLFARTATTRAIADAKEIAEIIAAFENKLNDGLGTLFGDYLLTPPWARVAAIRATDPAAERASYMKDLLGPLWQMRLDCEKFLTETDEEAAWQDFLRYLALDKNRASTSGPEFDRAQRHCAKLAWGLMTTFSAEPITGTESGPYREIASLLYEALKGEVEVDLKSHCFFVLDHPPPIERAAP